jgi:hypothetical protein
MIRPLRGPRSFQQHIILGMDKDALNTEIRAMRRLHALFEKLPPEIRIKLISWLKDIYCPGSPILPRSTSPDPLPGPATFNPSTATQRRGSYQERRAKIPREKL